MNLKEAFKYQNFLSKLMEQATASIVSSEHSLQITKTHKKHDANSNIEDIVEVIEPEKKYYKNDDVIRLIETIITERLEVSKAISKAKESTVEIDIDAEVEANKFRHDAINNIKWMMNNKPYKRICQGIDYVFNVEGNQTPYSYNIEEKAEYNYDRNNAKQVLKELVEKADKSSMEIDKAYINTEVCFEPRFNVHDSFEDIMEKFEGSNKNVEEN